MANRTFHCLRLIGGFIVPVAPQRDLFRVPFGAWMWVGTQWVITLSSGVGKKIVIDGFVDNSNRCCSNLIVNRDNLYVHNVISN